MAFILDDQYTTFSNETSVGDASSSVEIAQKIVPSATFRIGKVTVKIRKNNSPTDNVFIKVYTDSSGAPGTQVGGNSDVIAAASLTGSLVDNDFTWSTNAPNLTNGTSYWIAFCRSGSADGTNFY